MLAVEALPRLLPLYWHTVKGLEELFKEGGLHLPDKPLTNALRSIKDGERGWSRSKFCNMIYYCPGGNNKTFDSSKQQNKHGPIQSVFYFHRFRLQVKFIGKYLLKSSYPLDYTPLQHPDARTTPVRGIHDAIDRPIIVRLRHCGPGDRSPAKMRALIRVLTPSAFPLLPTSTTTLSRRPPHRRRAHGQRRRARRVVCIGRGHVVRPSNRRHHRMSSLVSYLG